MNKKEILICLAFVVIPAIIIPIIFYIIIWFTKFMAQFPIGYAIAFMGASFGIFAYSQYLIANCFNK